MGLILNIWTSKLKSKASSMRTIGFGEGALKVCAISVFILAVSHGSLHARTLLAPLRGVANIEVSVVIDASLPVDGLIEGGELSKRVSAFLLERLRDKRPDIAVQQSANFLNPELEEIEPGTLAIIISLTIREQAAFAVDAPCCFGAIGVRLDRDLRYRGPPGEQNYAQDSHRLNLPSEPLYLGDAPVVALDRAVQVTAQMLQPIVDAIASEVPQE